MIIYTSLKRISMVFITSLIFMYSLPLSAATTNKIIAISDKGNVYHGKFDENVNVGGYFVKNDKTSCTGKFNIQSVEEVVLSTLKCEDGRKGIAIIHRLDFLNGYGEFVFSDGEKGKFIYGEAATGYQ